MKEVLTIRVEVTDNFKVEGEVGSVNMCLFGGTVDCDNFKGVILPSGVDTQKDFKDSPHFTLSARYMLEGKDKEGQDCRIFIENNVAFEKGKPEGMSYTTPKVVTNSKALSYLETANLKGTIEPWEKGVIIHILEE
ncbi:MAG: DUF3237 family protein [Erysipelotrichaceae bacterium]|nr:DUF3237 family protein [Erysipelotrichaceae bacterium]